ncbi:MAG: divalent-cation tolerance protein CutA [Verrucomicrobia bacterium]|nr:divalent-cation tolerance protein CutA [Verrucomicrobiota bacterium]
MPRTTRHRLVLVTAPDLPVARVLSRQALEARLVACANLIPGVESHYWWQGRLESGAEVMILFKTTAARVPALEALVRREHPYDTPEFLVLSPTAGTARYLDWITGSVSAVARRRRG